MKTVTEVVRWHPPAQISARVGSVRADATITLPVRVKYRSGMVAPDPFKAGIEFHELLVRMADRGKLSSRERAYMPFLSAARGQLEQLGVRQIDIESSVTDFRSGLHGVCDLIVRGGPRRVGFVEFKLTAESVTVPRGRDIAQLGLYVHAARGWARSAWAALIYVHPFGAKPTVTLYIYRDGSVLAQAAAPLLLDAAA